MLTRTKPYFITWSGALKGICRPTPIQKFISKVGAEYVDFNVPTSPNLFHLVNPKEFISRMRMRWIGHHFPRADARWIGQLLAQLSPEQIRQAFRAANYSPEQVDEFATVVEKRIKEPNEL